MCEVLSREFLGRLQRSGQLHPLVAVSCQLFGGAGAGGGDFEGPFSTSNRPNCPNCPGRHRHELIEGLPGQDS